MSSVNLELRKGLKRRPSHSLEDVDDCMVDCMDDCMAAMVLMSLSCSPKTHFIPYRGVYSVSVKSIDSGVGFGSAASRSITPSPPTITEEPTSTASPITLEINKANDNIIANNTDGSEKIIISHELDNSNSNPHSVDHNNPVNGLTIIKDDEGIDMDETIDFIIDDPIQTSAERARRTVFKCTWRGCGYRCDLVETIEKHVRKVHLKRSEDTCDDENDHEEEFYYAEIDEEMEIENLVHSSKDSSCSCDSSLALLPTSVTSSPESPTSTNFNLSPTSLGSTSLLFFAPSPTWSHLDMARPPHEDPEYQKQQKQLHQQQQQNLQVQNHPHQQVTLPSVNHQTIISAQLEPRPERKTVISSPINIPGISVAHRWSTKARDSSSSTLSSASSLSASCNSSSYSLSNYRHLPHLHHYNHHHHHHHHLNHHIHHLHHNNNNQSQQASLLASSSSPVNLFSPKAPSKVMRLSSTTSSPVNIKSSNPNPSMAGLSSTTLATNTAIVNLTTSNSVNKPTSNGTTTTTANSNTSNSNNNLMAINSTHANIISTATTTSATSNSNQWTSLLQSSSPSSSSTSSSSSSTSSSSTHHLKGSSISPTRRTRTETRKCRKVYGMENRDSWCTQCKWKKACTRFVD